MQPCDRGCSCWSLGWGMDAIMYIMYIYTKAEDDSAKKCISNIAQYSANLTSPFVTLGRLSLQLSVWDCRDLL